MYNYKHYLYPTDARGEIIKTVFKELEEDGWCLNNVFQFEGIVIFVFKKWVDKEKEYLRQKYSEFEKKTKWNEI